MCTDILPVHYLTSPAAPLLRWLKTQQTDQQSCYYAKNVKGCLASKIIYVEHETLMGLRVSPVFQNTRLEKLFSTSTSKQYRQLHSFKTLQSEVVFSMYFHICLGYSSVGKTQA